MDGDERRINKKQSSEAGREMLAMHKAELNSRACDMENTQPGEPSDEEFLHNDTTGQSIEPQGTSITEGMSSRDITQSSMSISEGEGDGDLENIAGRVAELEEMLQGKEAVMEALSAEIGHLRAEASSPNSSQSQNSSPQQYRDILLVYHAKLQDFERAVNQRDNLIHDLTTSLEQALSARDALKVQLQSMAAGNFIPSDMGSCTSAPDHVSSLEKALIENKTTINQLNAELVRSRENMRKLEMEKEAQNAEIEDYKTRVNQLNEKIRVGAVENTLNIAEMMEMQKQYEARVEKIKKDMQVILEKFTEETKSKTVQHEEAMRDMDMKHQRELIEMKGKYDEQYQNLVDHYNQELPDLESKHAKELSVFQAQLSSYKKTVETLKLELVNHTKSQQLMVAEVNTLRDKLSETQRDKEMLTEQINLHKIQLDELTSKYVAAASILDSKESIERSLEEALTNVEMLKQENETLKFKHDDLSARYAAAQSLIENNQMHERTMSNRIFDLEKSLSRLSGMSMSMMSEFNETTYQTFDEVAVQYHAARQKLEERSELEHRLVEKIQSLEDEVSRANEQLNQANLEKESYEKQLKDMKNTWDKLRSERSSKQVNSEDTQLFQSSVYFDTESSRKSQDQSNLDKSTPSLDAQSKFATYENEITRLKELLEIKNRECTESWNKFSEMTEKLKQSETEREYLKNGLAVAWGQCAEFEEKLNQTLTMNESRLSDSLTASRMERDSEHSKDSSKGSNDTFKTAKQFNVTEKSVQTESMIEDNEESNEANISSIMNEIVSLRLEKENLSRELANLSETVKNYEELTNKLQLLTIENTELKSDNEKLLKDREKLNSLERCIAELTAEKTSLTRELADLADKHREELATVRQDCVSEVEKIRNLMITMKQGDDGLEQLRSELESRHAKEMEELRTYFEEKCLQMEKQYSDEIFSQQSKKMSDNDSEIEDLAEDLYFGGGGDCTNTRNSIDNVRSDDFPNIDVKNSNNEKNAIAVSLVTTADQLCQTEWDSALENGELTKLRAAYNNQLQEQIALAKHDIVNALEEQIQALLAAESDMEENWPPELLELRNKFTNNARKEMEEMKSIHASELKQLRDEHSRTVSRIIERHQEELKKVTSERESREKGQSTDFHSNMDHNSLIRERDNLYKSCVTLKELIVDLTKYFTVCEEELNNTLISEVLKRQVVGDVEFSPSSSDQELMKNRDEDTTDLSVSSKSPEVKVKRVHFAPQCSQLVSLINDKTENFESFVDEIGSSDKLRQELDNCLKRMKTESAQVLGITPSSGESMIQMLSKQVLRTTKMNDELSAKLTDAENIVLAYQEETRILKTKIQNLQQNLLTIESKKEIVSEGYGEHEQSGMELLEQDFSQLQEKARLAIMSGIGDNAYLLQLIEEFCRYNDKMAEETRREKEDLQQQVPLEPTPTPCIHRVSSRKIEAADKQLRGTRKFLEEQASEREIERDEAARQIATLQEQIKERDREKERDLRMSSESSMSPVSSPVVRALKATDINAAVEALESQMREMSSLMADAEAKKADTESELKAAVDKIWVLREVIGDLEQQMQARIEKEETLLGQIEQLEGVIAAQTRNQQELAQELDSIKMGGENNQLNEHITHLEEELRKHKLSTEHFDVNSSVLKQMKIELRDMQNQLDKRTRELEALHMCGSSLSISQPSEDVSIREQIDITRCPTPDDPNSPPTLPLDQLLKLKEKMLKHARAEEVAFKRIKDLDMQLSALKIQNEELQAEQEILQQTASEQLFQMEAMRGRLEQQKQSAPFAQRQATSRLELQLHEANAKLHSLEQTIGDKELEVNDLREQLQRAHQLLNDKQNEFMNVVQAENNAIQELKERLKTLEDEKKLFESKVGVQERAQVELPQLIDSMLADKNEEIDHLKEQLSKRDKQLQVYLSATNIDENQLAKQCEPKNSARTLSDILSIHSECEDYSEAIREGTNMSQALAHNISAFKVTTTPSMTKESYQVSPAVLIDVNKPTVHVPRLELGSSHSQSLSSTCPRHSRISLELIQTADFDLKSPSFGETRDSPDHAKSNGVVEKESRCTCSQENIQKEKSSSNSTSAKTPGTPSNSRDNDAKEQTLNLQIQDLENKLQMIQEELESKSTLLFKREAELNALQRNFEELGAELKESVETLTRDKEFYKNQYELSQASELKIRRDLDEVENTLKLQTEELKEYKNMMQVNEKILTEMSTENGRLKEIAKRKEMIDQNKESEFEAKMEELKNLQQLIFDKDVMLESVQTRNLEIENENKKLYEYKTRYDQCKKELGDCKIEMKRLTEGLNNRDQIIRRLEEMARRSSISGSSSPGDNKDQEIHHLQEYLKEKEKVIRQMSDDSKSLQRALETIQNKMKESGNVVELRKKLKEERRFNAELKSMVEKLKQELEGLKDESMRQSIEGADIEDMVQRELDLSARLDQQIMEVIESEAEETTPRRIEKHSCNSLSIKPSDLDRTEKVMQKYLETRQRLKETLKQNQELNKLREDREIEREMLGAQIVEYENRIFQLTADLDEKSARVKELDAELTSKKSNVRNLEIQLQREKSAAQSAHNHDSELISQLRIKLVASLDSEERVRRDLTQLRQEHKNLEARLNSARDRIETQKAGEPDALASLLEAEHSKYAKICEMYEKEQRDSAELRDTLKRVEAEKNRCEKELECANEEHDKLASSLALAEGVKDHLEIEVRRSKEELKSREEECGWLHKRIKTLSDTLAKKQQQTSDEHSELKSLRRSMSNVREVMLDLEADINQSKAQLAKANEERTQMAQWLEIATSNENELKRKLEAAKLEEERLKETINDLQGELQLTVKREMELTEELQKERLSGEKNVPAKFVQKIKKLNESIEQHARDNNVLHEKLLKARQEREIFATRVRDLESQLAQKIREINDLPPAGNVNTHMAEKLQHFYGKYLRVDSRRKALAYQKQYLLCIIGGYQLSEEKTLSILAQLTHEQRLYTTSSSDNKSPKIRFRCAALVIISIHRMKWMIHRWRTGRRVGANAVLGNHEHSFVPLRRNASNHSPPVRERAAVNGFSLEHYLDRFMDIQQRLGLAIPDTDA